MQADDSGAMAERLNRFALGLGDCVLTTVVLAVFEPGDRAPALHERRPSAAAARARPTARRASSTGAPAPPMGVMETPRYVQRTLVVEPGSTLLLYTDGLIERSTEVLDVGLERLRDGGACPAPTSTGSASASRAALADRAPRRTTTSR